ncbi:MAG: UbiA-like polyprenyltransferase [Pirellulales bacterium]
MSANIGTHDVERPKLSAWARVRMFGELIRFSHTIFALPFAVLSAAMALLPRYYLHAYRNLLFPTSGTFSSDASAAEIAEAKQQISEGLAAASVPWFRWQEVVGILLCMVFARSAAMAFNRVVDWKFDAENPRTQKRHIPAGLMSRSTVIGWTIACSVGFVASTLLFLPNRWPLILSVPFLAFICGYSLTKRFTSLAHFWLGTSLMLAPISAWIAILGDAAFRMPWPPIILGAAVLFWVAGFDIIYATQDVDVDRKLRLRSVPARFGVAGALSIAAGCHLLTVVLFALLPTVFPAFGTAWYLGVAAVAVLLIYEHALVRPDDLTRVNAAFFHCNAIVSLGLLAVGLLDLFV